MAILGPNKLIAVNLPISITGWTSVNVLSGSKFSAYIIDSRKIAGDAEIDIDTISIAKSMRVTKYTSTIINGREQYALIVTNESAKSISVDIDIRHFPH